jgi:hypothetical protein
MTLPTIPTDNFYKFFAISGVIIVIFSFAYPWTLIRDIRPKQIEVMTKLEVLKIELIESDKDIDVLDKEVTVAENNLENLISEDVIKLREHTDKINRKRFEISIKKINIGGQIALIDYLREELLTAKWVMIIGVILGCILSFGGFIAWYFIVQVPSDLLLRRQVESCQSKPSKPVNEKEQGG